MQGEIRAQCGFDIAGEARHGNSFVYGSRRSA
jgi:hypothetical protein